MLGVLRTCFAASDVTPLNGVTPAQLYPIRSQYSGNLQQPDLLQDRFDYVVIACSRLRDSGEKSFSKKKCEKRAGAGARQGGGACTHFLNGLFRYQLLTYPLIGQ